MPEHIVRKRTPAVSRAHRMTKFLKFQGGLQLFIEYFFCLILNGCTISYLAVWLADYWHALCS
jgi:hypothetical protein